MTTEDYRRARQALIDYLRHKTDVADWHGVSDAANDLRVLEAGASVESREALWQQALRWYGDKQNYGTRVCNDGDGHFDVMPSKAEEDCGDCARIALGTSAGKFSDGN